MALLSDSNLVTVESLLPYESDLLETSDRERVEVDAKIDLAVAEIRTETEIEFNRLIRNGSETEFTAPSIEAVVATPSLLGWLRARCLEHFYFECYGHQLNPRFKEKHEYYRDRAMAEKESYFRRGIGVVRSPLAKPEGAAISVGPGTIPAGVVYVALTWVNGSSQESSVGEIRAYAVSGTEGLAISHPSHPAGSTGWNVYIGGAVDSLRRQNASPLSLGDAWLQTGAPGGSLPLAGQGQQPDRYIQPRQIFLRG